MTSEKAMEARARRAAKRVGLIAKKSRRRVDGYNNVGEFALIDPRRNWIVAGERFELTPAYVMEYCQD